MGRAEEIIAEEKARRAEEAKAAKGKGRGGASADRGGAKSKGRKRGPARRWPLREWVRRGAWARLPAAARAVYPVLLVYAHPKTRLFSAGGRGALAAACGCDVSTVTRGLEALTSTGMVRRWQKTRMVNGSPRSALWVQILEPPEEPAIAAEELPGMTD